MSSVDALAMKLRERILDGALPGGARLTEAELSERYRASRHTVRAALRALEATGLICNEPNRGARVSTLDAAGVRDLHALRRVIEGGAVRLALERNGGRLPREVHEAAADFARLCHRRPAPAWHEVVVHHAALHGTLVAAADSPRLLRTHAVLLAELQLFLVGARPVFPLDRLATDHAALVVQIERRGGEAIEEHVRVATDAMLSLPVTPPGLRPSSGEPPLSRSRRAR